MKKLDTDWILSPAGSAAVHLARALMDLLTSAGISHGTICGLSFGDEPHTIAELRNEIHTLNERFRDKAQCYNAAVSKNETLKAKLNSAREDLAMSLRSQTALEQKVEQAVERNVFLRNQLDAEPDKKVISMSEHTKQLRAKTLELCRQDLIIKTLRQEIRQSETLLRMMMDRPS